MSNQAMSTQAMTIHWSAFGSVFAVSLGITLLAVVLFSLGIAVWPGADSAVGGQARTANRSLAMAAAVLCFGACLAVAAYGLVLIIGV
ncbi:hypothetical protein [Streptomyces sp. NPDC005209]|uniref:hypothetical protein n=1 Tax=Streptomyces sp. NPDC005209 TaxID=3156715 RepID=UPI0033A4AA77